MLEHFLKVWKGIIKGFLPKDKIAEFIAGRVANPTKEMVGSSL